MSTTSTACKVELASAILQVSKVRVTALIGNTYHARIHYVRSDGKGFQVGGRDGCGRLAPRPASLVRLGLTRAAAAAAPRRWTWTPGRPTPSTSRSVSMPPSS